MRHIFVLESATLSLATHKCDTFYFSVYVQLKDYILTTKTIYCMTRSSKRLLESSREKLSILTQAMSLCSVTTCFFTNFLHHFCTKSIFFTKKVRVGLIRKRKENSTIVWELTCLFIYFWFYNDFSLIFVFSHLWNSDFFALFSVQRVKVKHRLPYDCRFFFSLSNDTTPKP